MYICISVYGLFADLSINLSIYSTIDLSIGFISGNVGGGGVCFDLSISLNLIKKRIDRLVLVGNVS